MFNKKSSSEVKSIEKKLYSEVKSFGRRPMPGHVPLAFAVFILSGIILLSMGEMSGLTAVVFIAAILIMVTFVFQTYYQIYQDKKAVPAKAREILRKREEYKLRRQQEDAEQAEREQLALRKADEGVEMTPTEKNIVTHSKKEKIYRDIFDLWKNLPFEPLFRNGFSCLSFEDEGKKKSINYGEFRGLFFTDDIPEEYLDIILDKMSQINSNDTETKPLDIYLNNFEKYARYFYRKYISEKNIYSCSNGSAAGTEGRRRNLDSNISFEITKPLSHISRQQLMCAVITDALKYSFLEPWRNMNDYKTTVLASTPGYQILSDIKNPKLVISELEPKIIGHVKASQRLYGDIESKIISLFNEYCQIYDGLYDALSRAMNLSEIDGKITRDSNVFDYERGLPLGGDSGVVYFNSEKSLITLAAPGSGKTQCHVLPALNQYEGSVIVLDIKGECLQESGHWRHENVGPVLAFAPAQPEQSNKYNPLSFVSQDPNQVWEDARLVAEMLVVPKSKSDPTWETQGRQLLTLLIAYVAYQSDEERNMATILDLISEIGLEEAFDDIMEEGAPFPSSMCRTANKFRQMRETAEKQFQGVLSGASQHLTVWEGSAVEKITKSSDWSPEDFRSSPPISLYLCVPPNAIETYAPLLRVIIGQHVRELMKEEPDRNAPHILFMLDELPRLGKMEPIREALEVGRSYGIKLWMFAQYAGQLQEAYGKEIADGMIESCGARIYMNPGADTAEKLAKTLGTRENLLTGKTEPVVTPQELMGPEWRDDMLVFATGEPPLRLKKVFFHERAAADTTH